MCFAGNNLSPHRSDGEEPLIKRRAWPGGGKRFGKSWQQDNVNRIIKIITIKYKKKTVWVQFLTTLINTPKPVISLPFSFSNLLNKLHTIIRLTNCNHSKQSSDRPKLEHNAYLVHSNLLVVCA